MISRQACAKINLTFEVLGNRPDGYHEIVSVVQAISLCDRLTLQPADHTWLSCDVLQLVTPRNLAFKAVRLMQRQTGRARGVAIDISKSIPLASGLGGGSSNAAAVLAGLNLLWKAGADRESLVTLGADIGSDVPFFASGYPTALVRGRGEIVEPLPSPRATWVVLLCLPLDIPGKTARMYSYLEPSMYTRGQNSERLANLLTGRQSYADNICYNVFEGVALAFFSELNDYRRRFLAAGAPGAHLSGAGPTLFTLTASQAQAVELFEALRKEKLPAYLAQTLWQ